MVDKLELRILVRWASGMGRKSEGWKDTWTVDLV